MQTPVEITVNQHTLRGTLHIPSTSKQKYPLLIIYHGFGGNKLGPHFMFVHLSRQLEALGIASLRFDFSGSGESDGAFSEMTFSRELEEAEAILEYAKNLSLIDTTRIGVIGFSMGGALASVVAGKHPDDIKALSLWAPAGNMEQIVVEDFIGEHEKEYLQTGFQDYEGLLFSRDFVIDLGNHSIFQTAAQYPNKVQLIHGDFDEVVPLETSYRYIEESYGDRASLSIIAEANHLFAKHGHEVQVLQATIDYMKTHL